MFLTGHFTIWSWLRKGSLTTARCSRVVKAHVAFKTWKRFSDEKGKLTCYLLFHFRQMQHPCSKSTGWCSIFSLYSLPVGLSNITADLPCGAITSNTAGKHQIMHLLALFISFDTQESWFPSVWLLWEFGITSPIEKITST